MYDEFPWIKFVILTIVFVVPIVIFTNGIKWKILYAFATPIGIYLALMGKGLRKRG